MTKFCLDDYVADCEYPEYPVIYFNCPALGKVCEEDEEYGPDCVPDMNR